MNTKTKHWAGITAGILSLAGYASAANIDSEKYTYDASGNIIEELIEGKVTKMAYDQANRLIGRQTAAQNKETTTYDAAGRSVAEQCADGQPTRSMSYGYGDKVLEAQNQDSKTRFYYNSDGQLVGKQTSGNISTYTWDGNVLAADGFEAFANEAHISGGVPVLVSGTDVVVSDYLSNTLVSGDDKFTSTAYGMGLEQGRFTGKPYIKELEAFVFRNRLYSGTLARWTLRDPIGFPDGTNPFNYVSSDPTSKVDPLGLSEWEVYQSPQDPAPIGASSPVPLYNSWLWGTKTMKWNKFVHSGWTSIESRNGAIDERIVGIFHTPNQELPFDRTPQTSYAEKAELVRSHGNFYDMEQDWIHGDDPTVLKDGVERAEVGGTYTGNAYGLRYSREN